MLALDVQVLEWKHLKCVQMELTAMQQDQGIVFCVLQGIGERDFPSYLLLVFLISVSICCRIKALKKH